MTTNLDQQCHELAECARQLAVCLPFYGIHAYPAIAALADRIIAARTAEHAQFVEVAQLAGQLGWYVFVDGLLDCDIPACGTERDAWYLALQAYPHAVAQVTP